MIIEPFSFMFLTTASLCTTILIIVSMILVIGSVVTSRLQLGAFITFFSYFHFIIFSYPGLSIACLLIAVLILFNVFFKNKEDFKNKK